MRQFGILALFGLFLAFIAWQARTGIFRRHGANDQPANKYMRQVMENPQLTEADAAILRTQYNTASTNPSGLRYLVRSPGRGFPPSFGAEVVVHYEAFLLDGTKLESSRDAGKPLVFRVGTDTGIKGLDEALRVMKSGEKRTLLIPWWLAFGEKGKGPIPARATLRYEVELVEIR